MKIKTLSSKLFSLSFVDNKLYVFSLIFVSASVFFPWLAHYFHPLAGKTFLPMHFFVLLAGLIFGWRVGLLVGVLTPLTSHVISGMPLLPILPTITCEITTYGLVAGLLSEKTRNVWLSFFGALMAGRLVILGAGFFLLANQNSWLYLLSALKIGWLGIFLQILLIPLLSYKLVKWLK